MRNDNFLIINKLGNSDLTQTQREAIQESKRIGRSYCINVLNEDDAKLGFKPVEYQQKPL